MTDTKQKILDATERLFGEQGFDATSMRQIIAEAGVNLAAIHYHFGTKEDLLTEVVLRKVRPVNDQRLAMLDRAEAAASPGAPTIESVLEAFLLPTLTAVKPSPSFVKLMGRLHAEGLATPLLMKHFPEMIGRFRTAVRRAVPELSDAELGWRSHFMIGAMAHTLTGPQDTRPTTGPVDPQLVARFLIAFLKGGFHAPPAGDTTQPATLPAATEPVDGIARKEL